MRKRAVTLLGVAMLLLLAWSLNYLAHRGALGVGARRFAQIFTPIGSNARLMEAALVSPPPGPYRFEFRPEFAGPHDIGVVVSGPLEVERIARSESYAPYLRTRLVCFDDNGREFENIRTGVKWPWWSHRAESGFVLQSLSCPEDFSPGARVRCDLSILEGGDQF